MLGSGVYPKHDATVAVNTAADTTDDLLVVVNTTNPNPNLHTFLLYNSIVTLLC